MQPEENKWLVLPQSQAIQPPTINPRLEELNAVVRSTECLRHFVLSMEYWLSPSGRLRCWLKINLCVCAWLFIPAIFLMPVVSLVLHEVDGWLSMLLSIIWKLILLSTLISVVVYVIQHRHGHFPLAKRSPYARHRRRRKPSFGGIGT